MKGASCRAVNEKDELKDIYGELVEICKNCISFSGTPWEPCNNVAVHLTDMRLNIICT